MSLYSNDMVPRMLAAVKKGNAAEEGCYLERELAAAIAERDEMKLALRDLTDAAKELMDCKGYDLYPDGTMRPAHGLGEWVRAIDYDKLHAAAEAAQADAERYRWLRERHENTVMDIYNSISPAMIKPELIDAAIDAAMKECGK